MNSLFINKEVKISIKDNNFLITTKSNKKIIIPSHEVNTILIDDFYSITKSFFNFCNKHNITLIMTDEKHYPTIMLINPINPYFKMFENIQYQISFNNEIELKKFAWKKILTIKHLSYLSLLKNNNSILQENCLNSFRKIHKSDSKLHLLQIEGEFANSYYKNLFGNDFKRKTRYYIDKDVLNSFLNYGYSLLRSKILHYLTINGILPYFSIFHSSENNNFALADDLIECYRYVIDYLVLSNVDKIRYTEKLDKDLKKLALSVFTLKVKVKNKRNYMLDNAINLAIQDYKRFILTKDLLWLNTFKTTLY